MQLSRYDVELGMTLYMYWCVQFSMYDVEFGMTLSMSRYDVELGMTLYMYCVCCCLGRILN